MESKLNGEVIYSDLRRQHPRTIQRFVHKWMERWVSRRLPQALENGAYFHVTFDRVSSGHAVGCHVRLSVGDQLWSGANYGEDLATALRLALEHMVPQMKVTRAPPPIRRELRL